MFEAIRVLLDKPLAGCKHEWGLPKQIVEGTKVFIGRRCKLCGEVQ